MSTFWDPGRFVQTLAFFEVIPGWASLQAWLGGTPPLQPPPWDPALLGSPGSDPIVVISPGKELAESLKSANDSTANSSGLEAIPTEPGPRIRVVVVDCRGWSAETLLRQVQALLPVIQSQERSEHPLFDFRQPTAELETLWGSLDDGVMGGVSTSQWVWTDQGGLFAGTVSTANSGGFASVRTRNFATPLNLGGVTGIRMKVKGDGQRYKFFLRTDTGWDAPAYSLGFATTVQEWITVTLPFADMQPVFRARTLTGVPPMDPGQIRSFQLMLSKFESDQRLNPQFNPGPFGLYVESIAAYRQNSAPLWLIVSEAGRDSEPELVAAFQHLGLTVEWMNTRESGLASLRDRLDGLTGQGQRHEKGTALP